MTKEQRLILLDRFTPTDLLDAIRHLVRLEGKGWEPINPGDAPQEGAVRCAFHLVKVSGGNAPGSIVMTKTVYNGNALPTVHSDALTPSNVRTHLAGLCDQPGNDALFVRLFGVIEARSVFLNKLQLYTLQDLEGAVNRIDALLSVLREKSTQREIDLVAEEAHRECLFTGPVTDCRKSLLQESLESFRETAQLATSKRASIAELLGESVNETRAFLRDNDEILREYGYVFACTRSFLIHSGMDPDEAKAVAFGREDARLLDGIERKGNDEAIVYPRPDEGILLKEAQNSEDLIISLEKEWSALIRSVMVDGPGFYIKEGQAVPSNINGNPYRGAQLVLLALTQQRTPEVGSCWLAESQMRQLELPVSPFKSVATIAGGPNGKLEYRELYSAREVLGDAIEMPQMRRNGPAPEVFNAARNKLLHDYPALPEITKCFVLMQTALLTGIEMGPVFLPEEFRVFLTDKMSYEAAANHIMSTGHSLIQELARAGAICSRLERELLFSVTLESKLEPLVEATLEQMSPEEVAPEIEM